jgi:hypothetical protein
MGVTTSHCSVAERKTRDGKLTVPLFLNQLAEMQHPFHPEKTSSVPPVISQFDMEVHQWITKL